MNKVFIIAEAGVNHNGSLLLAKKLVDHALEAGADAVKFQTFRAENIVTRTAEKAKYQIDNMGTDESQYEMLKRLELSRNVHEKLYSYCNRKNILFLSTPFDKESADFLGDLGVSMFKIPSGEITNKPLIKNIAQKRKPIILSTGMSYLGEVERAIGWINDEWKKEPRNDISEFTQKIPQNFLLDAPLTLLHCVSNYPAKPEETNLLAMKTMRVAFGLPVGYSDHTIGIEMAIAAVALGARVIEKHFTLDKNMDGPDHRASLEPYELKAMIEAIRNVEDAMGDGRKKPTKSEEETKKIARKSVVAAKRIRKGDFFTSNNLAIKRPGTGLSPEEMDRVIGRHAHRDYEKDEVIEF